MKTLGAVAACTIVLAACGGKKATPSGPAGAGPEASTHPAPTASAEPAPEPVLARPDAPAPAPVPTPAPPPPEPALPEPEADFAALGKKKCSGSSSKRPAIFASPHRPNAKDPLRVFVVSEKKLDAVTLLGRAPDGTQVPLKLARYGGPPFSIYADLAEPQKGKYRFGLVGGTALLACRDIDISKYRTAAAGSETQIWPLNRKWSRDLENLYSAWIERLFDAPPSERPSWTPLTTLLHDPARNFFHGYLSLKEDGPGPPRQIVRAEPDCADTPFFLRAYFAWKMRLPYGNFDCSRGSASRPPTCDTFFSNTMPPLLPGEPDQVKQFNSFLAKLVANKVHSSSGRNAIADEKTDFYPIPLSRQHIRPGAVYIDPYGHLLVVSKWVDQKDNQSGMLFAVDGHPDLSIGRKRFWRGAFLFSDDFRTGAGGFKWFRPLAQEMDPMADGGVAVFENKEIKQSRIYGNLSFEQYKLGLDGFYDKMDEVLNPEKLDPTGAYHAVLDAVFELVLERIDSVDTGEKWMRENNFAVIDMPEGHDVFETSGPWEDYSTPSRDHRLLTAINVVQDFPAKVLRRADLFKMPAGVKPDTVRADLDKQLADFAAKKSFEYTRSDGSKQRVTLAQLLARKKGLEMSYNPNDCAELRWAAEPGTDEYKPCKRHAPQWQLERMALYRVWWATGKRPMRGQKNP